MGFWICPLPLVDTPRGAPCCSRYFLRRGANEAGCCEVRGSSRCCPGAYPSPVALSRAMAAAPSAQKVWPQAACVLEGDTLDTGGDRVRWSAWTRPRTSRYSQRDGQPWRCGNAEVALQRLTDGRQVRCDVVGRGLDERGHGAFRKGRIRMRPGSMTETWSAQSLRAAMAAATCAAA